MLSDGEIRFVLTTDARQGPVLRFLLATGLRIGEAYNGYREGQHWVVPSEFSKNRREHRVWLPDLALAQLGQHPWEATRDDVQHWLAKNSGGWCAHDLRRTFSTRNNDMGVAPHIVEKMINHTLGGVMGVAERRQAFVAAYIANGYNATAAAVSAGYNPKTAQEQGSRLLSNVMVKSLMAEEAKRAAEITGLESKRTIQELARIAYFDPLALFAPDGQMLPVAQWPADARACIASIDTDKDTGRVVHVRFNDKNSALGKAMKHHGLYERNNSQHMPNLVLQVNLVGTAPSQPPREVQAVDDAGEGRRTD